MQNQPNLYVCQSMQGSKTCVSQKFEIKSRNRDIMVKSWVCRYFSLCLSHEHTEKNQNFWNTFFQLKITKKTSKVKKSSKIALKTKAGPLSNPLNRENLGKSRNKIFPINGIQLYISFRRVLMELKMSTFSSKS